MNRTPTAIGLMTCDQVIVEEATRNITPVNCWTRRSYRQFPTEAEPFFVVAFLMGGLGEVMLEMFVHSVDNWDVIRQVKHTARFDDVLQEHRAIFRVRHMTFPAPGYYQVSLLADREILAQRKIAIAEKSP